MPTISLMSFLKILTKGTPQKVQEYGKYLKPGGYQFYWMLKESTQAVALSGLSYADELKAMQEVVGRDVERECNIAAFKAFESWRKKYQPDGYFSAPNASCTSPAGYLTVKLEPEFGIVKTSHRRLVQLWYSKNTSLSKHAVLLGTHLMQKHLCVGEFADCKAAILDLRKKELMMASPGTPLVLETMIGSEFAWVDSFFKLHEDASKAA